MNNKANAFRHALWNFLICKKVAKIDKNDQKCVIWAEIFTDLYEKVTKNEILAKQMDLHNNRVGRNVFLDKKDQNLPQIVTFLTKMSEKAQKIGKNEEFSLYENSLVYLE